jgi:hypothetical protein
MPPDSPLDRLLSGCVTLTVALGLCAAAALVLAVLR